MSSFPNELSERHRVSKVSFSSISSEVLMVKIRPVNSEVTEDTPKMSSAFEPIPRNSGKRSGNASTMTESQKTASISSQTVQKEQTASPLEPDHGHDFTPCLQHAAENISRKASDVPSEKISMCNNCSKSMLSYIFLVQDFLDSLAKEITGNDAPHCLQCARQEVRNQVAASVVKDGDVSNSELKFRTHSEHKSSSQRTESTQQKAVSHDRYERSSSKRKSRARSQESRKNEDHMKDFVNPPIQRYTYQQQQQQMDFIYNVPTQSNTVQNAKEQDISCSGAEERIIQQSSSENNSDKPKSGGYHRNFDQPRLPTNKHGYHHNFDQSRLQINSQNISCSISGSNQAVGDSYGAGFKDESVSCSFASSPPPQTMPTYQQSTDKAIFRPPMERIQPNYDAAVPVNPPDHRQGDFNNNVDVQSPTVYREDVDGIVSVLSNAEREIYDSARNGAGWESLTEPQERLGLPSGNTIAPEAFVTSCRNNAEAIGCLVVGTSLLLTRTTRALCVLVSDGVSTSFRSALSSVFQVVQYVRSLDSLGTTKLSLLEQPELGISFEKLNIWRLVQFSKCVYLNPDTLVIQNCDELFCREELSAVPDIGWPDCFNSGVFVYSPSVHTFWQLLEFAERERSYDGGDQGLLNSYFNSWSSDINKKLSFIYNLMANVSYTYTPAFRQFGRDVKIVQFHGSFKPWHVKFISNTGQISPASLVHPTYVQFVHIWINIFRISVLRLLSQEVQSYAASQETICAVEILRFFPLPFESEAEFFLTPPSVRLSLTEKKLRRSTSLPLSEARRRKSAEFFRYTTTDDDIPEFNTSQNVEETVPQTPEKSKPENVVTEEILKEKLGDSVSEGGEVFEENVRDENALPGSEIGDYQGMKKWEQGRMDYQGSDSSDNVIKRLEFLMHSRPK